jgi:hypothetical protein
MGRKFVVRPKKNKNCLIGRAARQAIEHEDLEREAKKWVQRKNTLIQSV